MERIYSHARLGADNEAFSTETLFLLSKLHEQYSTSEIKAFYLGHPLRKSGLILENERVVSLSDLFIMNEELMASCDRELFLSVLDDSSDGIEVSTKTGDRITEMINSGEIHDEELVRRCITLVKDRANEVRLTPGTYQHILPHLTDITAIMAYDLREFSEAVALLERLRDPVMRSRAASYIRTQSIVNVTACLTHFMLGSRSDHEVREIDLDRLKGLLCPRHFADKAHALPRFRDYVLKRLDSVSLALFLGDHGTAPYSEPRGNKSGEEHRKRSGIAAATGASGKRLKTSEASSSVSQVDRGLLADEDALLDSFVSGNLLEKAAEAFVRCKHPSGSAVEYMRASYEMLQGSLTKLLICARLGKRATPELLSSITQHEKKAFINAADELVEFREFFYSSDSSTLSISRMAVERFYSTVKDHSVVIGDLKGRSVNCNFARFYLSCLLKEFDFFHLHDLLLSLMRSNGCRVVLLIQEHLIKKVLRERFIADGHLRMINEIYNCCISKTGCCSLGTRIKINNEVILGRIGLYARLQSKDIFIGNVKEKRPPDSSIY
jgi:hypothetical protein